MKLTELKERIDHALASLREGEDLEVVIPNNLPSMGPLSVTNIKGASKGFDWNKGRFFIWPEKEMTNR